MAKKKIAKKSKSIKKEEILVIADGMTEINYIRGLLKKYPALTHPFHIEFQGKKANTKTIVNLIRASEYRYSLIFAFTDRDEMTNSPFIYNVFCNLQSEIGDKVYSGYSNPCFEVWLLMHFQSVTSSESAKSLARKITGLLKNNFKTNPDIFANLESGLETAVENAKLLANNWQRMGVAYRFAEMNPSTNVHSIVSIIKNYKDDNLD